MKTACSSVKSVSYRQLKHLLAFSFLVAIAFGNDDVGHSFGIGLQERSTGETDFNRMKREILETLRTERSPEVTNGGAVYVRWGRNVCGPGSDALYRGVAGGSFWNDNGGGSNYLCLPLDPIWGAYNEGLEKYSKLFGSEYHYPSGFSLRNNHNRPLNDNNVPCVVCRSQTKASVVMIPARNQCYNGMHTEYTGLLMSEKAHTTGVQSLYAWMENRNQIFQAFGMKMEFCSTTWKAFVDLFRVLLIFHVGR